MIDINKKFDVQRKGYYSALGYRSATVAAREGRSSTAASGEAHEQFHRLKLINQSREFFRDNPIYKGMIERSTGYIVGNGFSLQSKTGDANLNSLIEKKWKQYWKRPEIKNIISGRECERMVCRETYVAGDTGIIKIKNGKIQIIEAEQICGETGNGQKTIKTDSMGTPTGFWVGGYNSNGGIDKRTIKFLLPDVFLFVTNPERPSSLRSVPPCQASFPMLHRINDVCDSEAIAWQLLARLAVSVTRQKGKEFGYLESETDTEKQDANELTQRIQELDYALIFHGEQGDEIKGIERNVPGKNFSESLIMFLRLLGLPLGLPLEIILLDWTKSNYSQSRAVLEQAFVSFVNQQLKISDFKMSPTYEWWLRRQISSGEIKFGDQFYETIFDHDWIKPMFPWIDQLKEAQAWGEKLDRGLTLHQKALKSLGVDREDEMNERQKEIIDAINRAKQIEKETGIIVPWQIFAGLKAEGQKPIATENTENTENTEDTEDTENKNKKDDENA